MTIKTIHDSTGLDDLDPSRSQAQDATHFRAVVAAAEQSRVADDLVRMRVMEARAAGNSWTMIGAALGVSRQAAQQRFGPR